MQEHASTLRAVLRQLASPLLLAALAAWTMVAWVQELELAASGAAPWPSRAALLLFLCGFIVLAAVGDVVPLRRGASLATAFVMALAALVTVAAAPAGSAPILLVLLAAVLASLLGSRALVLALLALNAALLLLLLDTGLTPRSVLLTTLAYGSFQAFAALVMRSADRAEAMATDLGRVNAELLAARSLLEQSAREGERLRLSRELHDVVGHKLTALRLNLALLARRPDFGGCEELATAQTLSAELLDEIRAVVRQLREHVGVDPAPSIVQLAVPLPRPRVHLALAADARAANVAAAEALVRCAQEALTNAVRHSGARSVRVALARSGNRILLEVDDDGRGAAATVEGNGLAGMRERLQEAGGSLELHSAPGQGFLVRATVPAGDD